MTRHEKALYIRHKFNVSYHYALKILKDNDYDLTLACDYFIDMRDIVNNDN